MIAARQTYLSDAREEMRVAALVEISAAAAALARTLVKLRRMDVAAVAPLVANATDLRAVLGRGRWLPTMLRHVGEPPEGWQALAGVAPSGVARRPARARSARGGRVVVTVRVSGER